MKTPDPGLCDGEIYAHGVVVAVVAGKAIEVDAWVRSLVAETGSRLDWHYAGGRAMIKHLGDAASEERVLAAIRKLPPPETVQLLTRRSTTNVM